METLAGVLDVTGTKLRIRYEPRLRQDRVSFIKNSQFRDSKWTFEEFHFLAFTTGEPFIYITLCIGQIKG